MIENLNIGDILVEDHSNKKMVVCDIKNGEFITKPEGIDFEVFKFKFQKDLSNAFYHKDTDECIYVLSDINGAILAFRNKDELLKIVSKAKENDVVLCCNDYTITKIYLK